MKPVIKTTGSKKLAGLHRCMSLAENTTGSLFAEFMPLKKTLSASDSLVYSLQVYEEDYFRQFSPERKFDKYALMEIPVSTATPDGLEVFYLPAGLYAVFLYKGLMGDHRIFEYIFREWLPSSEYLLDQRPHFEILSAASRPDDPESEEEIWIPVKLKAE